MANQVPKVKRGQKIIFRAEHWNSFADAANDHLARQLGQAAGQPSFGPTALIVPVTNDTGYPRERYDILGIDKPFPCDGESLTAPERKALEQRLALRGVMPVEPTHYGRFAVLLEPVPEGAVGRGLLAGVTLVRLYVHDENHRWADIKDADATQLQTAEAGAAFILWKEPGTGQVTAIVRLGVPSDYGASPVDSERVSTFCVHYSGVNEETAAFHSVGGCKYAKIEICVSVHLCSGNGYEENHPGNNEMERYYFVSHNRFWSWGGDPLNAWTQLSYALVDAGGTHYGEGIDPWPLTDFFIEYRLSTDGVLELRVNNDRVGEANTVSAVIAGTISIYNHAAPPGTKEIGNCCCHEDDPGVWGDGYWGVP